MTRSPPKIRNNPFRAMSTKLVHMIGIPVVGLHQGPRTYVPHQSGRTYGRSRPNRSQRQKNACQGRPSTYGAVAVCDFSLDHAGPQLSLRAVVGGLDLARIVAKDQKLLLRPTDFGLQLACEVASCRRGKKGRELLFKLALFAGDRRGF